MADFMTTRVAVIGTADSMRATSTCREVGTPEPNHGRAGLTTLHNPEHRPHRPLRHLRLPVGAKHITNCSTVPGEVNR